MGKQGTEETKFIPDFALYRFQLKSGGKKADQLLELISLIEVE